MPVSLKNTNYGDSHAARRAKAIEAPPAPVAVHKPIPVLQPGSALKVASDKEVRRRKRRSQKDWRSLWAAADAEQGTAPGDVEYDNSEENDDTDAVFSDPKKPKKKKNNR